MLVVSCTSHIFKVVPCIGAGGDKDDNLGHGEKVDKKKTMMKMKKIGLEEDKRIRRIPLKISIKVIDTT